jgi:nitrite reductase/ring-hydroxylating ferredoxin subunit
LIWGIDMQDIFICNADQVLDGGKGVRFPVEVWGETTTGFVIRYDGQLYAYLNRCAHVPIELDWEEGVFFESGGSYLMCATHGAIYVPETGDCVGGPCRGGYLRKVRLIVREQQIFWQPDDLIRAPKPTAVGVAGVAAAAIPIVPIVSTKVDVSTKADELPPEIQ